MDRGPSEVEEAARRRVGAVLRGKYRLDRLLGVGGMAAVYRATHRNQAEFAVKVLHPRAARDPDTRARFRREGYAANSVRHPGVVKAVDDDVDEDGSPFLVMELLTGVSVEQLCARQRGVVSIPMALAIAIQLLDVLSAAHQVGIVHRDVKPENLFVTHEGVVKVLDFGVARARPADVRGSMLTGPGMLMGTPAFMSPEQASGRTAEVDAQSDVWSCGATLYTLLTGRIVHEASNVNELLIAAATKPAPRLAMALPGAPPALAVVIDRALAFQKSDRWSSAAAMREALEVAGRNALGIQVSPAALALEAFGGPEYAATDHGGAALATTVAAMAPAPRGSARSAPELTPAMGSTVASPWTVSGGPRSLLAVGAGALLAASALMATYLGLRPAPTRPEPVATPPQLVATTTAMAPTDGVSTLPELPPQPMAPVETLPPAPALLPDASAERPPRASAPSRPAPSAGPAVAPAAAGCDPNYFLDQQGRKHFKPECF